jgi:hypothetical protein
LSGAIQFAYTLGPGAAEYLVIVGRDESGRTFLYEPASDHDLATALRPGRDDEPLSSSIRLAAAGHHAGAVEVKAFFASRSDATTAIRALVERGQAISERDAEGAGLIDEQVLRLVIEP